MAKKKEKNKKELTARKIAEEHYLMPYTNKKTGIRNLEKEINTFVSQELKRRVEALPDVIWSIGDNSFFFEHGDYLLMVNKIQNDAWESRVFLSGKTIFQNDAMFKSKRARSAEGAMAKAEAFFLGQVIKN